jgi:DNA topoisomerase-6 subunit B
VAAVAEELAKGQKEISVAEFFERNRQILGFDSPIKALVTSVKEAVDNALDACEEASILPDIRVEITPTEHKDEYTLSIEDNGPGIVQKQMPNIFGRLLYGSRFHQIRQSRGQQGIGISAVVLYCQITTGHNAHVVSKIGKGRPAVEMELSLNTKTNEPKIHSKGVAENWEKDHGTRIEVVMKARYQGGAKSVFEYLRSTSIVNPHGRFEFLDPTGELFTFERADDEVPVKTVAIKPHPLGTELGTIMKMAHASEYRKLSTFLQKEFSSVGSGAAKKILEAAGIENINPQELNRDEARKLYGAFQEVKIMAPPTDCLSPIGEALVRRGLKKETVDVSPEYIATVTRPPAVWGGHPFQVEVGVVFGGSLPKEGAVRVLRFANRVPLLYAGGGCECSLGVQDVDWRRYGLEQRAGKGLPNGPAIILVHVASTKVPFTSEAKEAVAPMEEIHKEIKLALQEAARGLGRHLKKKAKRAKVSEKFTLVGKILPEINRKAAHMLGKPEVDLSPIVCKIMDVVWIDDAIVEYEKLEGQLLESPKAVVQVVTNPGTLAAFDEDSAKGEESDDEPVKEAQKPKQAFLARASIAITNYKQKSQKFRLFAVLPDGAVFSDSDPKPKVTNERFVAWDIPVMKPTEQIHVKIEVGGVGKGGFDDIETYVEGINEIHVVGADQWYGGGDDA